MFGVHRRVDTLIEELKGDKLCDGQSEVGRQLAAFLGESKH